MEKILFVHTNDLNGEHGGSQRTLEAIHGLKSFFFVTTYRTNQNHNSIKTFICSFFGYLKCSRNDFINIKNLIIKDKYTAIFFDDSVNGKILKKIKRCFKSLYCISNFHNNETIYYSDVFKAQGVLYLPFLFAAVKNQEYSKVYADFRVYITKEDFLSIDNKVTNNFAVIPVTLNDQYQNKHLFDSTEGYFLFLGSFFFANIEAAKFIVTELAPQVHKKIIIAGNGMNNLLKMNAIPPNVTVVGFVDDLRKLFNEAIAFICPIFSGSGMKVKISEALMYGKTIIGTKFATIGYDTNNKSFILANNKEEFVNVMNNYSGTLFNGNSRKLFLEKYSSDKDQDYYKQIYDNFLEYKKTCFSKSKLL